MFTDLIKLVFVSILGGSATLLNIASLSIIEREVGSYILNIPFINATSQIPIYMGALTTLFGFVSAAFTCTYMYFQIKKIRQDLKHRKNEKNNSVN